MRKIITFMMASVMLTACGIKPGDVEGPENADIGQFPRTYPDVMTDPPPYVPPAR